jgi:hypothetical protein
MKENPNTSGTLEGLPLVGIESSNNPRKERRRTSPVPSNFMIIFRLENACQRIVAIVAARSSY